ncbi:MAG: hypothetical protein K0S33_3099 [Bacteroidetes bacterium]|jgi:hypothetical protein|nr:hypothetical protein [Bacteroidota bacterium]
MRKILFGITVCSLLFASCKKSEPEPEKTPDDPDYEGGPYVGKLKVFDGLPVLYNSDGQLTKYNYHEWQSANALCTVKMKWEMDKMTYDMSGSPFGVSHAVYPRNSSGNCLPSPQNPTNTWTYDSLNRLSTLNSISYYWSPDGNIDSIQYLGMVEIYTYSSALETRDYGNKFMPIITQLPKYLNKNLRTKTVRLDASRDTLNVNEYTHQFNTVGWVIQETEIIKVNGTVQSSGVYQFEYYE